MQSGWTRLSGSVLDRFLLRFVTQIRRIANYHDSNVRATACGSESECGSQLSGNDAARRDSVDSGMTSIVACVAIGQVSFLGNSTARRPRLSVRSSFSGCSQCVVRVLKLCHDLVKAHFVRDWRAGANVFFAKHGNLYGANSPTGRRG